MTRDWYGQVHSMFHFIASLKGYNHVIQKKTAFKNEVF